MTENNKNKIYEAKVITLGDSGVGKTNFIFRFIDDKFSLNYFSTYGIDAKFKNVKLDNGCEIKFKIFDTAGQERFKSISTNYIKKANGILLMYDITDKGSFENIGNWMETIKENSGNKMSLVLVATKSDLNSERVISAEEGEKLAKEYGIKFFETSSKDNINITEVFYEIAEQIIEKDKGKKIFETIDLKNKNNNNNNKQTCC